MNARFLVLPGVDAPHPLIALLCLSITALAGCASQEVTESGVLIAYGHTVVEVDANPAPEPERTYRRAEPEDVVSIMVDMACSYPDGPSDLERQAFVSVNLEAFGINPDTYKTVFVTTVADVAFADHLEEGMAERCPSQLEEILAEARIAF